MSKGAYIGVGGVARKIKKGYIGVGGVARKIKKGYIGVGGVARPFWSGGELAYYGAITSLSGRITDHNGASLPDYAIFGGGCRNSQYYGDNTDLVTAYDSNLVKYSPTVLDTARRNAAAASTQDHVIFAGGQRAVSGNTGSTNVCGYDNTLTRLNVASLSNNRYAPCSASTLNYAVIAGGNHNIKSIDAYSKELIKTSISDATRERGGGSGVGTDNYILIGCGSSSTQERDVDAYSSDLTKLNNIYLSEYRSECSVNSVGEYIIFVSGIGKDTATYINSCDVFNGSLVKLTPLPYTNPRYDGPTAKISDFMLVFCGKNQTTGFKEVDIFDDSLVHTIDNNLQYHHCNGAAAVVGNYAITAGGCVNNYGNMQSAVEAYHII